MLSTNFYAHFTGDKTKESFDMYQEDITDLKWKTEQQVHACTLFEQDDFKELLESDDIILTST